MSERTLPKLQAMVAECVRELLASAPDLCSTSNGERWLTGFRGRIPSIENWVSVELARRLRRQAGVLHIHFNAASSDPYDGKLPCPGHCKGVQRRLKKSKIRGLPCTSGAADRSHKHRSSDHAQDSNREIYPDLTLEFDAPGPLLLLELKSGRVSSTEVRADLASVHAVNVHGDVFADPTHPRSSAPPLRALFVYVGAEPITALPKDLLAYWPEALSKRGIVSACHRGLTGNCDAEELSLVDKVDTIFIP